MGAIIHSLLLTLLGDTFFNQSGTIQRGAEAQDGAGAVVVTWADAWANVRCRISPQGGGERRSATQKWLDATDVALLAGNYAADEKMRFVVGARTYEILNVEHDSESAMTRLTLRTAR